MTDPEVLRAADAAALLGYTVGYLYKLVHLGRIPHYKPTPRRLYFRRSELEAYAFRGRVMADYERDAEAGRLLVLARKRRSA